MKKPNDDSNNVDKTIKVISDLKQLTNMSLNNATLSMQYDLFCNLTEISIGNHVHNTVYCLC